MFRGRPLKVQHLAHVRRHEPRVSVDHDHPQGHPTEVQHLGRTAKEIAAEIGEELIAVKQKLAHGEFKPWVEANCSFSDRHARRYMGVAEAKRTRMSDFKLCNSIADVLALGKPKPTFEPERRAATLDDLRKVAEAQISQPEKFGVPNI